MHEPLIELSFDTHGHLANFHGDRVELKPGINAESIDADWLCKVIHEIAAHEAVHSSAKRRKGRLRRVAEALIHEQIYLQFNQPQQKVDQPGHFLAGRLWYVRSAEFQEAAELCLTSMSLLREVRRGRELADVPPFLRAWMEGFLGCLNIIDLTAKRLRKIHDPDELHRLRKTVIGLCYGCNGAHFEEPLFQKAGMAILSLTPRKPSVTSDLAGEAQRLYVERHKRVQAAKLDYTKHKGSPAWSKHVEIEDKKRPGKPKIPLVHISQLSDPEMSPRTIALNWTAEELNRRDPNLAATANTVRRLLEAARKADMRTIHHNQIG